MSSPTTSTGDPTLSPTTSPTTSSPTTAPTTTPTTTSSTPTTSSTTPTTSSPATTSTTPTSSSTGTTSSSTTTSSTLTTSAITTTSASVSTTAPHTTSALTTTQGGAVVTQTSTQFVSSTSTAPTSSGTAVASGGSKGFFANTGAVAGVFSVVGLIVLAIAIALITNGIRRRRARKFDRELAAATLEAASAPKPIFLDDEDDEYGPGAARGGYGGGSGGGDMGYGGQYSDASSHGTYAQPAMSAGSHGESYGMREMSSGQSMGSAMHNVGPGDIFDPYAVGAAGAAGAAGIGVARARSGRVAGDGGYAAALQEGSAPYAAFAVPTGPTRRPSQNNVDILEAAGMGAHAAGAGAVARGPSVSQPQAQYNSQYQPYPASQQGSQLHQRSPSASAEYANLDRSRSSSGRDAVPAPYAAADAYYPPQQQGGYAQYEQQPQPQHYDQQYNGQQYGQQYTAQGYPQQHQYESQPQSQPQQSQEANRYSVADDDDAYGGYVAEEHPGETGGGAAPKFPNAFGPEGVERERERDSSAEDDEPKRVLKVANE